MKSVIKFLLAISLITAAGACSQKGEEDKATQLKTYRSELSDLKSKIRSLEKEIASDSLDGESMQGKTLVRVKDIVPERFEHFIDVVGSVEAVNEAYISPETGGRIRTIAVNEGDFVKAGQLIARLNTDVTDNSIAEIKTQLDLATVVFKKQEELWKQKIGSEIDFLQAKSTKESLESRLKTMEAQLDMAIITAPISGVVEEIMQKEGELASPGMMLMRIINLQDLYINSEVAESHLPSLREGEKVTVSFPTWPDLEMHPTIYRVGSAIHALNRSVTVTIKIKNTPDQKLRPNLLANMKFMDFESDSALVVPSICIKQDINGAYLYVMHEEGNRKVARKAYVTPGEVHENMTMINDGISEGDQVIVEGYNLVTDESEVRL